MITDIFSVFLAVGTCPRHHSINSSHTVPGSSLLAHTSTQWLGYRTSPNVWEVSISSNFTSSSFKSHNTDIFYLPPLLDLDLSVIINIYVPGSKFESPNHARSGLVNDETHLDLVYQLGEWVEVQACYGNDVDWGGWCLFYQVIMKSGTHTHSFIPIVQEVSEVLPVSRWKDLSWLIPTPFTEM